MGSYFTSITAEQSELIRRCSLFFVATADPTLAAGPDGEGPVNLSPKGGVTLHQVSPQRVAFLDARGSGNAVARHANAGGPVTVMVCSFEAEDAAIVRLYGHARAVPLEQSDLAEVLKAEARHLMSSPRQVIVVDVERTLTSCGYGVPVMQVVRERRFEDRGRRYKPTT